MKNPFEDANRELWNKLTDIHVKSYGVDRFKTGESSLDSIQLEELGDIRGKTLLHLQCHFGLDTLSLARQGAIVTGVDFSEKAVEQARRLSDETGIPARFIQSNVYGLENILDEKFEIVYTTQGVLCWLKDLKEWARIIAHFLKPGGMVYLMETHPILIIFNDTKKGSLEIIHNYFHNDEPTVWDDNAPDYSDPAYNWPSASYEWRWTISDIINSLISTGLIIEFLNEYDKTFYKALPDMIRDSDGYWVLPDYKGKLPLMFTLRARKPL
jgi:SAM-dependent methyltransferase